MDRFELCQVLAAQRAYCRARSPFYAEILGALEDDARAGAAWTRELEAAWRERSFAVGWEAAHLLLACLHYSALRGASEALSRAYPSCGGDGRDGGAAVIEFLRRAPGQFWDLARCGLVQTNEVGRSVPWMLAAAIAFGPRRLPFHLVELGASAGLNLIGDRVPQSCRLLQIDGRPLADGPDWNRPQPALTRTGLDLWPRSLDTEADRLWLKACVWADDLPRLARLDCAIEAFAALPNGPGAPHLERCSFLEAPQWLAAHRPPHRGEGLLVFNSIATVYLDDRDYALLCEGMVDALAPWGDRAVWVEYERPRTPASGPLELTVHRVVDGRLRSEVLATGAPRPEELRVQPHAFGETVMGEVAA